MVAGPSGSGKTLMGLAYGVFGLLPGVLDRSDLEGFLIIMGLMGAGRTMADPLAGPAVRPWRPHPAARWPAGLGRRSPHSR